MTVRAQQQEKLRRLLAVVRSSNPFYRSRLPRRWTDSSLESFLAECPLLTKAELMADRQAHPPYGTNLSFPLSRYTRWCQTSGTTGEPLATLDTPEDWRAMLACWHRVYAAAGVRPGQDRVFFAFSFGPFLGFWTAFEAALSLNVMAMPGGGLSTQARLQTLRTHRATVLCCTPTYAVRLGEARAQAGGTENTVRLIIVAGEPGGSIPATRARIESLWPGARVFDHHGLTETGPVSHEDPHHPGRLRVIEQSYLAEVLTPDGREAADGEVGELVLTTLDRLGCPLLRYRTGDLVRKGRAPDGGLCLDGGILGRRDDMVVVRGVNVYPSAVENILRRFPQLTEYQVREEWRDGMLELRLAVELTPDAPADTPQAIERALHDALALRIAVDSQPPGSLPRFEFKSKRWIKAPPPAS